MTAFLGMYDLPALRDANDRYWSLIRAALGEGPEDLDRTRDPWEIWRDPALVLAQTCGMPYRTRLHGHVQLVGTPDFDLPGCPPGHYNSVLVARADGPAAPEAFAGRIFAYNEALSQSGWAAPMTHLNARGVRFAQHLATGAHLESARAVASGRADLAGIDAMTWELIRGYGELADLREIARTAPTPGLPYITATGRDPEAIARAIEAAIAALEPQDRATLHLHGLERIPAESYLAVANPPAP